MRPHAPFLVSSAVLALACGSGAAGNAGSAGADAWPELRLPADSSVETISAEMLLNGKPCRMVRFRVRASDDDVMAFYRTEFGPKRVENKVKTDRVIATRQGDYFVTLQLRTLDKQTVEGTAMTTMIAGKPVSSPALVDTKKLLPADTQVLSTVQTSDAGQRSLMVIGVNHNSVRANRDHVIDAMTERGFRLTKQEGALDDKDSSSLSLQLASPAEEAAVTISDAGAYRSVVINRIREAK
jgi:hypothetical protein